MAHRDVPGGLLEVTVLPNGRTDIVAHLSGVLFQEDGQWVSYCEPLRISTCGDDPRHALERSREAIQLFFDVCLEQGALDRALDELHWVRVEKKIHLDGLVRRTEAAADKPSVPPAFVVNQLKRTDRAWHGIARLQS